MRQPPPTGRSVRVRGWGVAMCSAQNAPPHPEVAELGREGPYLIAWSTVMCVCMLERAGMRVTLSLHTRTHTEASDSDPRDANASSAAYIFTKGVRGA